jgi:dipeptidyl-peptidase-4
MGDIPDEGIGPLPVRIDRALVPLFALFALALLAPARAQDKILTLEDLRTVNFYGSLPYITCWLKDGAHYLEFGYDPKAGAAQVTKVDARTGASVPFYDARKMEAALAALSSIGARAARELAHRPEYLMDASQTEALLDYGGDLYIYDFPTERAIRLTDTPNERETNASFSPDGRQVAFVKQGDLYTATVDGPGKERRITKDGGGKVRNGRLDWVYEEEVYGRGRSDGYAWSPDSKQIAFLRIDDSPVKPFVLVDQLPRLQNVEEEAYPKAGDPNPIVTLGVANGDGSGIPRFVDVSKYAAYDRLIVRYAWHPDGKRLTFQVQNRTATFLDLNIADAGTGKSANLLREKTPAWVEIIENPLWLKDGTFLWQSDRTGYRHLYHCRADGALVGAVTKGEWDVRSVYGVDPKGEYVYFSANEHSPIATHAYRVSLDGKGIPTRLTGDEGDHDARFSPDFALFLDTRSNAAALPELRLRDSAEGKEVRVLSLNEEGKRTAAQYKLSKPEFLQVKTRDGFLMEACLLKPSDFVPNKKYPVFIDVYAGPGSETVRDEWDWGMWHQFLAQHGYIVWECDNRSASGKGMKSAWTIYKKMGAGELADIEDSVTYLKSLPYVDGSRIGISGWSYGGFMAEYALTHSTSFKIGISGAGVSDWRLYDTIYTERYMDTPQANPEGYRAASPTQAAANCTGKLLLLHGMMDDNVHLQNTVQMIYALQRAGKDFEMMLYPGPSSRHGIGDPLLSKHLREIQWRFIQENL